MFWQPRITGFGVCCVIASLHCNFPSRKHFVQIMMKRGLKEEEKQLFGKVEKNVTSQFVKIKYRK